MNFAGPKKLIDELKLADRKKYGKVKKTYYFPQNKDFPFVVNYKDAILPLAEQKILVHNGSHLHHIQALLDACEDSKDAGTFDTTIELENLYRNIGERILKREFTVQEKPVRISYRAFLLPVNTGVLTKVLDEILHLEDIYVERPHEEKPVMLWPKENYLHYRHLITDIFWQLPFCFTSSSRQNAGIQFSITHRVSREKHCYIIDQKWCYSQKNITPKEFKKEELQKRRILVSGNILP